MIIFSEDSNLIFDFFRLELSSVKEMIYLKEELLINLEFCMFLDFNNF